MDCREKDEIFTKLSSEKYSGILVFEVLAFEVLVFEILVFEVLDLRSCFRGLRFDTPGDDEADLLIFEENLLKHQEKTNEKGTETIKWNGKISDLKDFVTLLIKEEGKWSSEKISNKKTQIFTQKDSKFTISWKNANKTLDVDGQHKMAGTVRNKINRLITKRDANKTIEVSDTQTEPGEADNYVEHSTSDVKQKKKLREGNQKLLKRLATLECQTPQQSLVRLIIMLNIPLQMASKRKKLKKGNQKPLNRLHLLRK